MLRTLLLIVGAALGASAAAAGEGRVHEGASVLALSWQPAFCERARRARECAEPGRNGGRERLYRADGFALHGLWPQPRSRAYCDVPARVRRTDERRRWRDLPALGLPRAMRPALARAMPGAWSFLHRHEWVKHGTCYSPGDPARYFADSLRLQAIVNQSAVGALFASHVGRPITARALRLAFDSAFGVGAGARVRMACRDDGRRRLVAEITLGMAGDLSRVTNAASLGEAMRRARTTQAGCPRGIVDPPGFQ